MKFSDLKKIGTLGSVIDRNGMIRFKLLPEFIDIPLTDIFLIFKNKKVRYVSVIKEEEKRGMYLLLDDTEVMAEAAAEKGVVIALPADEIANALNERELHSVVDYNIYLLKDYLGKVVEQYDNGAQLIITVEDKDNEFMIPLVEKYVCEINHDIKQIIVKDIEELRNL